MMKRILIILCPLLALVLPVLLAVASRSAPDMSEDRSAETEGQSVAKIAIPLVAIDEQIYDFGTMDPLQKSSHAFVIRNEGSAPLELRTGSTTCKCTVSELTHPLIQPGHSGEIRLSWNTGRLKPFYSHGATILTNDPSRASIDLRVRGIVRVQLAASPAEIVLDGVEPDQPRSSSTWIYSQVWDEIQVEQITCTSDRISWEVEPVAPSERPDLNAKSACRLTVTLPAGMPKGFFKEVLRCQMRSTIEDDPETLEVGVSGKVLRRLALYGPGLDPSGTLDLGVAPRGQSASCRLLLKIRDSDPELAVRSIESTPEFLDVQVLPYQTSTSAKGLYHLNITVPSTAPECVFRGANTGRIKIAVEHPRIDDLELRVRLAVTDGQ